MEKDSFVTTDIGALINDAFIAIKVDRELHPAVDELYIPVILEIAGLPPVSG